MARSGRFDEGGWWQGVGGLMREGGGWWEGVGGLMKDAWS